MQTDNRCCRVGIELKDHCTKERDLYVDPNGRRWCAAHLPTKNWQQSCTHTPSAGAQCGYCKADLK